MNEAAAKDVLLVRSVEITDTDGRILTADDREFAGRAASELVGWRAAERGEPTTAEAYLAKRAELLVAKLAERYPKAIRALRRSHWQSWLGFLIPVIALVTGFALGRLGNGREIDLLAPPLIGLLAWNFAIYLWLLGTTLFEQVAGRSESPNSIRPFVAGVAQDLDRRVPGPLAGAIANFGAEWIRTSAPLIVERAARVLHLSAAVFAIGTIAGFYARGLHQRYVAGWESTFLDSNSVYLVIEVLFKPAAYLLAVPFPSLEELGTLDWANSTVRSNAGQWIHLIAATVAMYIVVPRLAFAALALRRERQLTASFPLSLNDPYFSMTLARWRDTSRAGLAEPRSRILSAVRDAAHRRIWAAGAAGTVTLGLVMRSAERAEALKDSMLGAMPSGGVESTRVGKEGVEYRESFRSPAGDSLCLATLPASADPARLAQRLRRADSPWGWIVRELWDRLVNPPLWRDQRAAREARRSFDGLLYIANPAPEPTEAALIRHDLQVLNWIGKPALLLLDRSATLQSKEQWMAVVRSWDSEVMHAGMVRGVVALGTHATCWVQESAFLRRVAELVPQGKKVAFDRLSAAWQIRHLEQFEQSMEILAGQILAAAKDREEFDDSSPASSAERALKVLGFSDRSKVSGQTEGAAALAKRADERIISATNDMLKLHGRETKSAVSILEHLRQNYDTTTPTNEGVSAAVGGALSGAMTGLIADLATGGLTLGAGFVVGAVAGALGGAGIARGHNALRGVDKAFVTWSNDFLDGFVRSALLRYLAVAHFDRETTAALDRVDSASLKGEVEAAFKRRGPAFSAFWKDVREAPTSPDLGSRLSELLAELATDVLDRLYPNAMNIPPTQS